MSDRTRSAGLESARTAERNGTVPRVTLMLASHDRLSLLKEAVESALAQVYPRFEVLVVDDGSGRETTDWLRSQAAEHGNLRVSFQAHEGVGAARAHGVRESTGEIICVLDSDDLLAPNALAVVVDALDQEPRADLVYVDNIHLLPNGERRRRSYPVYSSNRAMLWATLLSARVPFKHTGTAYRRNVALALGSYDSGLPCKVDIDLFLKFLVDERPVRLVREPLAFFRRHERSMSRDRRAGIRAWFVLIDRYAPGIPGVRWPLKLLRAAFETAKWAHEQVLGR